MDKLDCLRAIADLSEKMLAAATDSRWSDVEALEAAERQLAQELAALPWPDTGQGGEQQRHLLQATLQNHAAIFAIADPLHADLKTLLEAFSEASGTEK